MHILVWQEVFDNGDTISESTVIQVWQDWGIGWQRELALVRDLSKFSVSEIYHNHAIADNESRLSGFALSSVVS